jgi:hypothetical protein
MNLRQTCAQSAMTEVLRALAAGANPNDGYGTWIPLGWAIRNKAPEIAVVLIEAGAHRTRCAHDYLPLHISHRNPGCTTCDRQLVWHLYRWLLDGHL